MPRITTDLGEVDWPDALLKPLCETAADVVVHRRMTVPEREVEGMLIDVGTTGVAYGTIRIRSGGYVHTIRESLAAKLLEEHPEFRPAQTLVTKPTTSWASSIDNFASNVSYSPPAAAAAGTSSSGERSAASPTSSHPQSSTSWEGTASVAGSSENAAWGNAVSAPSLPTAPVATTTGPSPASEGPSEWFVNFNNRSEGPFTAVDVIKMVNERLLTSTTGVWRKGEEAWTPIAEHPEFRAALEGEARPMSLADPGLDALVAEIRTHLVGTNRILKPEEVVQFRGWIDTYIERGSSPLIQQAFRKLLESPETPAILKARLIQQIGAMAIPELAEAVDRALEQKAMKAFAKNPELRRALEVARRSVTGG
jgi:hypothetical protein